MKCRESFHGLEPEKLTFQGYEVGVENNMRACKCNINTFGSYLVMLLEARHNI